MRLPLFYDLQCPLSGTKQILKNKFPQPKTRAGLVVDGEHFELSVDNGNVDVRYREATDPEVELETNYEAMVAVADGDLSPERFAERHIEIRGSDPGKAELLMDRLARAMTQTATT